MRYNTKIVHTKNGDTLVLQPVSPDTFTIVEDYPKLVVPIELHSDMHKGWLVTLTDGNTYLVPLGNLRQWLHENGR